MKFREEIDETIELMKQDIAILESSKSYNYAVDELKQKVIVLQKQLETTSKKRYKTKQ